MMNTRMVLGISKTVAYVGGCLGIGVLCGTTAFPAFKERLGVKKVHKKFKDIPEEEIMPDASFFEDADEE